MCHHGRAVWVCVSREGRGWGSLGTGVHLIDSAKRPMWSCHHLKIHLQKLLRKMFFCVK